MFLGDDWAEAHHDIELQDCDGRVLARRRLPEGVAGIATLHALIGEHLGNDDEPDQVLWAINPIQSAPYRQRHTASGAKSDPGDAQKNYSGMSPVTKASGTKRLVLARHARNRRLSDALYQQAFAALTGSPGARVYYDRQRARGASHHQALRTLANRLVGVLHGCLTHHTPYDETTAWAAQSANTNAAA